MDKNKDHNRICFCDLFRGFVHQTWWPEDSGHFGILAVPATKISVYVLPGMVT